ncbi:MAG: FtsH protease activity modulator HflK [Gammaproteobacteria bacterium]|nr:FtsH protease activity modulator HflK [Gammaproteobacteria bacterium]MBV9621712.1 FtsH protease activity modulator HflK [Gammaproteobacteria bacterium]
MAWNQPNGGQNNPWGRRPGGAANDLDARLKSWQRKLESWFRPGGSGGEGSWLFFILLVAVLIGWLGSGIYQVGQAERGVIQRFGRFVEVKPPGMGWHAPWPIETVTKVNVTGVNSSDFKSRVLTADVNLVELHFAVQYQFSDPVKALFRVREPEETLSQVSESAIREIVGRSTLDDVQAGKTRPEIIRRTQELIQRTLDYYDAGITVTTVNLVDVGVPEPVVASRNDANKAQADKERYVLEAQAYQNSILPVAQGTAARMQQDAQAYKAQVVALAQGQTARFTQLQSAYAQAPEVTRRRLYMDTLESVLARAHKVLIDAKAGNNLIYLPIDKLLEKSNARESEAAADAAAGSAKEPTDQVTVEARGRGER